MEVLKVGDHVLCNGFEGVVSLVCSWDTDMVEVRLDRGVVCVGKSSLRKI